MRSAVHFFFFVLRVQGADGSFPKPLTPDEEAVLLRRMQQDGDAEAREKLIEHNLRLVAHIVKKYYAVSTEQDDLLSIGTIGLIKAVNTFKADKNIRLATYASKCIQNELLMYFRQKRKSSGELSLSDTLESDGDGNALALQDIICCEDSGLSAVEEQDRYHAMHRALAGCLSPREREIIRLRYGIGLASPLPQREIAARLGISRSYVSRIEKACARKAAGGSRTRGTAAVKAAVAPFRKNFNFFEKGVDESRILIYTKQVVSDESSKRQQNLTNSRIV